MKKKYKVSAPFPNGPKQAKVGDIVLLSDVQAANAVKMGFINKEPVKVPDAPPKPEPSSEPKPKGKGKAKPKAEKPDETKPDAPDETK